jgi:hypothetical protein
MADFFSPGKPKKKDGPYPLTVRFREDEKAALYKAARAESRSWAKQASHYVRRGLIEDGYLVSDSDGPE